MPRPLESPRQQPDPRVRRPTEGELIDIVDPDHAASAPPIARPFRSPSPKSSATSAPPSKTPNKVPPLKPISSTQYLTALGCSLTSHSSADGASFSGTTALVAPRSRAANRPHRRGRPCLRLQPLRQHSAHAAPRPRTPHRSARARRPHAPAGARLHRSHLQHLRQRL